VLQEREIVNHTISILLQAKAMRKSNHFLLKNLFKLSTQISDLHISKLHGTVKDML